MIVIISGTNRTNSQSRRVADFYQQVLREKGEESRILDLRELPVDFLHTALYENTGKNTAFNEFQRIMEENDKFVFVVPEYNGSYPGVLKGFIDGLKYPGSLLNKKAALVGVSTGMQGAAVALSHFADVLSYMGMHLLGLRLKLAQIKHHMTDTQITSPIYVELMNTQARQLMEF